jgi:23S rRNA (adenine1618-N6)-methyltransferase
MGSRLDIVTNCIYPIIGNAEYGWSFVGTDIDEKIENCSKIIEANPKLVDFISTNKLEIVLFLTLLHRR